MNKFIAIALCLCIKKYALRHHHATALLVILELFMQSFSGVAPSTSMTSCILWPTPLTCLLMARMSVFIHATSMAICVEHEDPWGCALPQHVLVWLLLCPLEVSTFALVRVGVFCVGEDPRLEIGRNVSCASCQPRGFVGGWQTLASPVWQPAKKPPSTWQNLVDAQFGSARYVALWRWRGHHSTCAPIPCHLFDEVLDGLC